MSRTHYKIDSIYNIDGYKATIIGYSTDCSGYTSTTRQNGLCKDCHGLIIYTQHGKLHTECGYYDGEPKFQYVGESDGSHISNCRW